MSKRRGQASVVGTVLFSLLMLASIAALAAVYSGQVSVNDANARANQIMNARQKEILSYTVDNEGLEVASSASGQSNIVAAIFYTASSPPTEFQLLTSTVSNKPVNIESALSSSGLLSQYRTLAASGEPVNKIGLVTSFGNTFWFTPATQAASFSSLNLNVTVSPAGVGSVYPQASGYVFGSIVLLVAVPTSGYQFQSWTIDGTTNSSNPYTLYMTKSHNVVANFASPSATAGFIATVQPGNVVVKNGTTASMAVSVYPVAGFNSNVSLSVSGLSSGLTYSFSPSSGAPPFQSILTVTAPSNQPVGSSYVNVVATSGATSQQTSFLLTTSSTAASTGTITGASGPPVQVTFDASGVSGLTGSVLTVDGASYQASQLPFTFQWAYTSKHTYSWVNGPASQGTRVGVTSVTGYTTAPSGTVIAIGTGTVKASYATQYQLTINGGSGVSVSPTSPTGDGYYASGTSVQVSSGYTWNTVSFQSRQNLYTYTLDTGSPVIVSRAGSGTYTTPLIMTGSHTLTFNSATQYYLTINGGIGAAASGTSTQTGDGWYDSGTSGVSATSSWTSTPSAGSRTALTNYNWDGGANVNPTRSNTGSLTTSTITMNNYHTVNFATSTQYQLTVSGGSGVSYSVPSQTGDSFWDSGTGLTVSSLGVYSRSGGSGQRVASWNMDGGANTNVATTGTVTTSSITMTAAHAVNFNSATQYQLTVNGGSSITYVNSQTLDGWYDSGTSNAQVQTGYTWSIVSGQSRQSLTSYDMDGGGNMNIARASTGTYTTASITMSSYHTVNFNGVTQYALNVVGGNSITYSTSPFNDGWADTGTSATATTNYVWNTVAGQSRANLVSWNLDGGGNTNLARVNIGTFTPSSITVDTYHTLNFNSVTQYYLTVSGGSGTSVSGSQTSDGWFDSSSSTAQVSSSYVWNTVSGQSRTNLIAWNIDGESNTNFARSNTGTATTSSITMGTYHTVNLISTTQYYLTISTSVSGTTVTQSGSPTGDNWYDSGSGASISATTPYVVDNTGNGYQYDFYNWQGSSNIASPSSTSTSVTMATYYTVTAHWTQTPYIGGRTYDSSNSYFTITTSSSTISGWGTSFTAPVSFTIGNLYIYCKSESGSISMGVAVYSSSKSLLGYSYQTVTTTAQWYTFGSSGWTGGTPSLTAGQSYYFVIWSSTQNTNLNMYIHDTYGSPPYTYNSPTWTWNSSTTPPPSTASSSGTAYSNGRWALYALAPSTVM